VYLRSAMSREKSKTMKKRFDDELSSSVSGSLSEESGSDLSSSASGEEGEWGGDYGEYEEFSSAHTTTTTATKGAPKSYNDPRWDQAATIPFESAEFAIDYHFRPRDLLKNIDKTEGKIVLELKKGKGFYLGKHNKDHFNAGGGDAGLQLDAKHRGRKHRKHRHVMRDIFQKAELLAARTNYEGTFVMELSSVPALQSEGFVSTSGSSEPKVSRLFMAGEMRNKARDYEIHTRKVTNRELEFQNHFNGLHADNLREGITKIANSTQSVVPLKSPLWTPLEKGEGKKMKATKGQNFIIVEDSLIEKYMPVTESNVRSEISLCDITNNPTITLSVPAPDHRQKLHNLWVSSGGKEGKPWQNFAEPSAVMTTDQMKQRNTDGRTLGEVYMDTEFHFTGKQKMHYRQCNDEKVKLF
jgi:hypothetical protein